MQQLFQKLINKNKSFKSMAKKIGSVLKKAKTIKIALISFAGIVVLAVPLYLAIKNPGFILAAKVNNTYITRFELNKALVKTFGPQLLEELAYRKLAEKEFKKSNISVSKEEVAAKIGEIEQSLGGMSLEEALSSNGMTLEDLNDNVRFQLAMEKLLGGKVQVTPQDVADFISSNTARLEGMTDEEKNIYAQEQVKNQNLQIEMGNWFNALKQNAKIKFYL